MKTEAPTAGGLVELVYVSSTVGLWEPATIADILKISRRNNALDGITGLLVHKSGSIIQVLEGPEPAVRKRFDSIAADARHHQVTLLYVRPIAQRIFGDWAMAYREFHDGVSAGEDGYHPLLEEGFDFGTIPDGRAHRMLQQFSSIVR